MYVIGGLKEEEEEVEIEIYIYVYEEIFAEIVEILKYINLFVQVAQ